MRELRARLRRDPHWSAKLRDRRARVHLAVLVEPWLGWLIAGDKTVESRWSVRRGAPYGKVANRDVLLLKASSGPVVGIAEMARAWYFDLAETPLVTIRRRFGKAIAGDEEFWESVQDARYVSLFEIAEPRRLEPIECPKRDRRGWVAFD